MHELHLAAGGPACVFATALRGPRHPRAKATFTPVRRVPPSHLLHQAAQLGHGHPLLLAVVTTAAAAATAALAAAAAAAPAEATAKAAALASRWCVSHACEVG